MNRRALLTSTVLSAVSAAVFTATGWLMGARALTMPQPAPSPWPCPPQTPCEGCGGIYTGCNIFTPAECVGSGCGKLCLYHCFSGVSEYWSGCTSENPLCSWGFLI